MAIEYTKERDDLRSEQYNKLAQKYHELEALLKRWNEIANNGPIGKDNEDDYVIFNDYTNRGRLIQSPELKQLIQDTSEAIK